MHNRFNFVLNENHKRWIRARSKHGRKGKFWKDLISKQGGKCALTGASLFFDSDKYGKPQKGGPGCHPLYASVDHTHPGRNQKFQILCYDINDLKGHLPALLFDALKRTPEWKKFILEWKETAERSPRSRKKFKNLIKNGTAR